MTQTALLKYNLWAVETGVLGFSLFAFDWKVMVLLFLTLWWTKLHTKISAGER